MNHRQSVNLSPSQRRCLAVTMLVSLLGAGTVSANDSKILPGSACEPVISAYADRLIYGLNGSVSNRSDGGVYVTCPMVRDKLLEPWYAWSISVRDQHPTRDISCTLATVDKQGRTVKTKSIRTLGTQFLDGGPINEMCLSQGNCSMGATYARHSYAMRCYLPGVGANGARSSIISYELEELD